MPQPAPRPVLALLMTGGLLLGSAGCHTAGQEVAPGISRGAANTFTTLAADVETVSAAAGSAMNRRGLSDVRVVASEDRGEITGTWLDHTVKATVRRAGTRTAKVVVPHTAGSLLARKLTQDIDALVYGLPPELLPRLENAEPVDAGASPPDAGGAGSATARRENPLAK